MSETPSVLPILDQVGHWVCCFGSFMSHQMVQFPPLAQQESCCKAFPPRNCHPSPHHVHHLPCCARKRPCLAIMLRPCDALVFFRCSLLPQWTKIRPEQAICILAGTRLCWMKLLCGELSATQGVRCTIKVRCPYFQLCGEEGWKSLGLSNQTGDQIVCCKVWRRCHWSAEFWHIYFW